MSCINREIACTVFTIELVGFLIFHTWLTKGFNE